MIDSIKRFFVDAWTAIRWWLDPDYDWRSFDKIEHLFGGFAVCLVLQPFTPSGLNALAWTMVIGLVYELGQADVARSQRLLGKPGYGIGLLDLVYDCVGALMLLGFRAAL
jgi:hypothetical protein